MVSETWEDVGMETLVSVMDSENRTARAQMNDAATRGDRNGGTAVKEFEIRLYGPHSRRALCFTRVESPVEAASLARRWQTARPECRVRVVPTTTPRPYALAGVA
jgi:hypothetical protein